ncbi:MAG: hypothetical protein VW985_01940, partial [Gammaproteobacteria bacterium]
KSGWLISVSRDISYSFLRNYLKLMQISWLLGVDRKKTGVIDPMVLACRLGFCSHLLIKPSDRRATERQKLLKSIFLLLMSVICCGLKTDHL